MLTGPWLTVWDLTALGGCGTSSSLDGKIRKKEGYEGDIIADGMKNIDRKQKTREESRGSISYYGVLLILLGNIQHWAKERERGEKKEEEKKEEGERR